MKFPKIATLAIASFVAGFASQASATVLTFDLTDTPNATLGNGAFYEFTNGTPRFDAYSFEQNGADVTLTFNEATNTADISGRGFNTNTGTFATFDLRYDNAFLNGDTLHLNDMDRVGTIGGEAVFGKGFDLTILGDSLSGSGWLEDSAGGAFGDFHLAGTLTNGGNTGPGGNGGAAGAVPTPGPLSLIGAMALMGLWRRKRAANK